MKNHNWRSGACTHPGCGKIYAPDIAIQLCPATFTHADLPVPVHQIKLQQLENRVTQLEEELRALRNRFEGHSHTHLSDGLP